MSSKKKTVAKAETFNKEKASQTLKAASGITIETAAKKVTEAQLSIGKTLSDVTNTLQNQLQELDTVTQAVQLKQGELETIYSKEQVLKNLDELNVEFEAHKQAIEDQKDSLDRERQQEMADFQFNLDQTRRNEQAQFEENRRLVKNQQRDEDEARNKAFLAREEELKKQESELIDLRAKAVAFPEELKKETDKQVAIATNSVKREYEHKLQLMQKDFETANTVHNNTVAGLNARLAANDKVIGELTARLASSEEKVSTIATKALEAASATKSLADVQNLIQTQNNGQSARKA